MSGIWDLQAESHPPREEGIEYVVAMSSPESKRLFDAWKYDSSSCVIFAKQYTGRNDFGGWAKYIKPKYLTPYVGAIVITSEGQGHVAVVTSIENESITVIEANFVPNQITTRKINIDSTFIKGYL